MKVKEFNSKRLEIVKQYPHIFSIQAANRIRINEQTISFGGVPFHHPKAMRSH